MKGLTKIRIINFLFIVLSSLLTTAFAQEDVNNAIVPQYGNYSFSYNQVPEPLVSQVATPPGYCLSR